MPGGHLVSRFIFRSCAAVYYFLRLSKSSFVSFFFFSGIITPNPCVARFLDIRVAADASVCGTGTFTGKSVVTAVLVVRCAPSKYFHPAPICFRQAAMANLASEGGTASSIPSTCLIASFNWVFARKAADVSLTISLGVAGA